MKDETDFQPQNFRVRCPGSPVLRGLVRTLIPAVVLSLLAAPVALEAQDATRVISLGGSVTETVFALDADDRLVGADQSSIFPAAATELPDVGYFRTLGLEGVLSLDPDLVLALEGSGPAVVLEQLEQAGVRVVHIPADETPEAAIDKARRVAAALGIPERGAALAERIRADLDGVDEAVRGLSDRPSTLFVWGRGGRTMQVSGRETAAASMLELVHARTAITEFTGYRPLTPEAAVAAAPDAIVIDRDLLDQLGGVDRLLADPALGATPAAEAGRVIPVDVLGFLGFGPRTGELALELIDALHRGNPR